MILRKIYRQLAIALLGGSLAVQPVAAMQFGGIFGGGRSSDRQESQEGGCEEQRPSIGRSILGRVVGRATRETVGSMGTVGTFIPQAQVANELTNSFACMLDPTEQQQAADATIEVTRGEQVGATSTWTSETRPNVSGSSTATSRTTLADGTTCMDVTDIAIVNGEETRVNKTMCRAPGETRYRLMNA